MLYLLSQAFCLRTVGFLETRAAIRFSFLLLLLRAFYLRGLEAFLVILLVRGIPLRARLECLLPRQVGVVFAVLSNEFNPLHFFVLYYTKTNGSFRLDSSCQGLPQKAWW